MLSFMAAKSDLTFNTKVRDAISIPLFELISCLLKLLLVRPPTSETSIGPGSSEIITISSFGTKFLKSGQVEMIISDLGKIAL